MYEGHLFLWRTVHSGCHPAGLLAAPLNCRGPPRPDPPVLCSGFGFDRLENRGPLLDQVNRHPFLPGYSVPHMSNGNIEILPNNSGAVLVNGQGKLVWTTGWESGGQKTRSRIGLSFRSRSTTCLVKNTNKPQAVRVGAEHGGAAGLGREGQKRTPTGRVAQRPTVPLDLQGFPLQARKKGNPM